MRRVTGSLPNLLQGVSQQPAPYRLPGQHELQENMISDIVQGLNRRPPTELLRFFTLMDAETQFTNISTADGESFLIAYRTGSLNAWRLSDGQLMTITELNNSFSYLPNRTEGACSIVTKGDRTYFCNPKKIVAMQATTPEAGYVMGAGCVYCLGGQYGVTYKVTIKFTTTTGVTVEPSFTFATPDGSDPTHVTQVNSEYIATQLTTAIMANADVGTYLDVARAGDVISIKHKTWTPDKVLSISCEDGAGGAMLRGFTDSIVSAERLSRYALPNQYVRINSVSQDSDFYMCFRQDEPGFGKDGVWRECSKYDEAHQFDASTMPHVLKYDPDAGTFTFDVGVWYDRRVGDNKSNPPPSFVGRAIADLTTFQSRLTAIAGPAVCMARTEAPDEEPDWWRHSAVQVVDTDPIDMESAAKDGVDFRFAIAHNRDLVLFTRNAQFLVSGRSAITPQNRSLTLTTQFECSLSARPVPAGKNVFFGINVGKYSGIREFFAEAESDQNNALTATSHVGKYIEGNITQMQSSTNFDILLVQADTAPATLYVFQYTRVSPEDTQAAWHKWFLPGNMRYMFFIDESVYFVHDFVGHTVLSRVTLERSADEGVDFQVHLDLKMRIGDVHVTKTVPYVHEDMIFVQGAGCPNPGMLAPVSSVDGTTVTFYRDMQGGEVIIGVPYKSRWRPTRPFIRDRNEVPVLHGKLVLTKYRIAFENSGEFDVKIESPYKGTTSVHYSGRTMGDIENVVGEEAFASGAFVVPVRDDARYVNITVECDSHTPLYLSTISWEGQYTERGKRV